MSMETFKRPLQTTMPKVHVLVPGASIESVLEATSVGVLACRLSRDVATYIRLNEPHERMGLGGR